MDRDTAVAHRGCMETTDSSSGTDRLHKVAQVQEEVTVVLQGDTRENWGEHTLFIDEEDDEENEMLTCLELDVPCIMRLSNLNIYNCNVFWLGGWSLKQ